jgi:hypothetical protein
MSEAPFDVREQLARIDHMIAETQTFQIEQLKPQSELQKYLAEQTKLFAESRKLDRDRSVAPWQIAVVAMGGLAALLGGLLTILKGSGAV